MTLRHVTVQCRNGLHLKIAGEIAKLVQKSPCKVWIVSRGDKKIDASSVLQLLTLGAKYGTKLKICAEGANSTEETNVISSILKILQNGYEGE